MLKKSNFRSNSLAIARLKELMEEYGTKIVNAAGVNAKLSKRKTIRKEDFENMQVEII